MKNPFKSLRPEFKTRSQDRDTATDSKREAAIAEAIDTALAGARAEHAGLKKRLEEVISNAAIVGGNEVEYGPGENEARSDMLRKSDQEIRYAEERLRALEVNITRYNGLKDQFARM